MDKENSTLSCVLACALKCASIVPGMILAMDTSKSRSSVSIHLAELVVIAALLFGCSERPSGFVVKLASGKQVTVLQVTTIHFSSDRPAWTLRYETAAALGNSEELMREVCELWDYYRQDVERSGQETAIITAIE